MNEYAEKLFRAVGDVKDDIVAGALELDERLSKKHKLIRFTSAASVAAVAVIVLGAVFGHVLSPVNLLMVASAQVPRDSIYNTMSYDLRKGIMENASRRNADLNGFWSGTMRTFLPGGSGNSVFSPVCVYNGLSMAAEITDGDTRAQILELLGENDIGSLRADTKDLWLADYRPDTKACQVTASSLWLNEGMLYKKDTLDILANDCFASTYKGKMGSAQYDEALHGWLNNQTGGLLKDYVSGISMKAPGGYDLPVIEIVSTVNFTGKWLNAFSGANTAPGTFHAPTGDTTCDFMHQKNMEMDYFWGEKFSGGVLYFKNNGASMRFILPDEGYTPENLLADDEAMYFISGGNFANRVNDITDTCGSKWLYVDLAVPKFDISQNIDLSEGLKKLGITDIFDAKKADFSPLTDVPEVAASRMSTAARVLIDEEGCKAAAYFEMPAAGAAAPPTDHAELILDRPFLFTIFTLEGQPLFSGIIRDPTAHN